MKITHGGVLILVKLQAEACNFTKIYTPPWVFFTFFKLYKWYQMAQRTTFAEDNSSIGSIATSVVANEVEKMEIKEKMYVNTV